MPCPGFDSNLDFDRSVFLAVIRNTVTSPTGNQSSTKTLDGPQQIVFLAYHKSKLSTELSPLSNRGYPVSGSVEIITKFER